MTSSNDEMNDRKPYKFLGVHDNVIWRENVLWNKCCGEYMFLNMRFLSL